MPNYSIVANTTFRNRSFEDLLKPLAMYTAEYNSIQDAVGELDTKASVWEGMANKEQDPVAYAQFKRYSDELKEQANLMATQGLTPKSRISLQNLKSRYASEIIPIEQAYTNRKMQADEQRKALLQNPTLLLSRRADATSLDEYLKNPQLGYDSYSGALLTQQVGTAAATLAKSLRDYGRGKPLDAFTSTWLKQHGYTAAEVAQAINYPDHPSSNKILTSLVNNVIADSGIPQWADRPTLQQAYNYANQGLWQAVGQTDVTPFENYGARLAAQEASQKRVAAYQHALANQQAGNNNLINPLPLRSQNEISETNKKLQEYVKKGYFYKKDGAWRMSWKGWQEYKKTLPNGNKKMALLAAGEASDYEAQKAALAMPNTVPSDFKKFMDGINGGKALGWNPGINGNIFNRALQRNESGSYDTYHSTEYDRLLDSSYSNEYTNTLWANARKKGDDSVVDIVDFNGKNGWKTIDTKSKKDLDGYKITNVRYSKYGNTAILQKDGENPIRIKLPKQLNPGAVTNVNNAIKNADIYGEILHKNKRPKMNGNYLATDRNGNILFTNENLTPEDIYIFTKAQRDALNEMGSYGSQFAVPSTTKNEEYNSFAF